MAKKKKRARPYSKWIVLPDLQIPHEDKKTVAAVEAYMADVARSDHPFDGWLQLGDFLDLSELSKYNLGYEASIEEDLFETFKAGNTFLDRHVILMEDARMVLLQGNHDYRTVDFAKRHPHMGQLVDFERNLQLGARGIEFVPSWENKDELFRLGNAHFLHGHYLNKYHAARMVEAYGVCIFYGHTHDVMEYPKVLRGANKTIIGKSLGCLCEYDQQYLMGAPTNWQQAFSEFYIFEDGYFQENTVRIFKHRFVGPSTLKVYTG